MSYTVYVVYCDSGVGSVDYRTIECITTTKTKAESYCDSLGTDEDYTYFYKPFMTDIQIKDLDQIHVVAEEIALNECLVLVLKSIQSSYTHADYIVKLCDNSFDMHILTLENLNDVFK